MQESKKQTEIFFISLAIICTQYKTNQHLNITDYSNTFIPGSK